MMSAAYARVRPKKGDPPRGSPMMPDAQHASASRREADAPARMVMHAVRAAGPGGDGSGQAAATKAKGRPVVERPPLVTGCRTV